MCDRSYFLWTADSRRVVVISVVLLSLVSAASYAQSDSVAPKSTPRPVHAPQGQALPHALVTPTIFTDITTKIERSPTARMWVSAVVGVLLGSLIGALTWVRVDRPIKRAYLSLCYRLSPERYERQRSEAQQRWSSWVSLHQKGTITDEELRMIKKDLLFKDLNL